MPSDNARGTHQRLLRDRDLDVPRRDPPPRQARTSTRATATTKRQSGSGRGRSLRAGSHRVPCGSSTTGRQSMRTSCRRPEDNGDAGGRTCNRQRQQSAHTPGRPRAAIAATASPYGLRLHDDRRPLTLGVTYVPTHEGPITWDICREPTHPRSPSRKPCSCYRVLRSRQIRGGTTSATSLASGTRPRGCGAAADGGAWRACAARHCGDRRVPSERRLDRGREDFFENNS